MGVLHAKIIAAITLMGPQWWLKTVIEQVNLAFFKVAVKITNKHLNNADEKCAKMSVSSN